MAWKSLSVAQFRADLAALGVIVQGSGSLQSCTFSYAGANYSYDSLNNLLAMIAPDTYYKDGQGYHYVQATGTTTSSGQPAPITTNPVPNPLAPVPEGTWNFPADTGQTMPTTGDMYSSGAGQSTSGGSVPGSSNVEGQWYLDGVPVSGPLAQVGITYTDAVEAAVQQDSTIDGDTLRQQLSWQEDAAYDAAVYGPLLAEAFGADYTSQEWYILASGAQGSGLMRAKIAEAQNRIAFREAYRLYNLGDDPDPADYDYLMANYINPNEFVTRMAAKESAKQMFDKINTLLQRTLNHSVTLAELENLAVNGAGSGELEAMIDEAERLDGYTDSLYQWLGRTPTADDYAREIAGFPSVDAFKWEITVRENVKAMGDEINNTLQRAGQRRYSTDELRIMLGKSEGWGDLQAQYNKALQEEERQKTSRLYAASAEKISPSYTSAFQGGIKEALPELADLGGM